MRLPNVKFAPTGVPTISEMVGMAAQAVGDGLCHTCLVIYPTGNLEGRYRRGGENADDYARGVRQWTVPWGNHGGNDFINIFPHNQYCLKYGGKHDDLAPFVVNQHRNGLLTPWGYNASHQVPQLTIGARQVRVRAETALAAFTTPSSGGWIMFNKHPN